MLSKSEVLRKLIEEYDVKTTKGVQKMLEAELQDHLGYEWQNRTLDMVY